jgi:hypothetical protein
MSAGVLLVTAGIWVLCQVFGGNALGRLGISGAATTPGGTDSAGEAFGKAAGDAVGKAAGMIPQQGSP